MKKLISFAAAVSLLLPAIPGLAADIAQPESKQMQSKTPPQAEQDYEKNMLQMQEQMKKMQEQMDKIRQTQDPAERQKLFQEHWTTMQRSMSMMNNMYDYYMGGGPMTGGSMMRGGMMMGGPMMHGMMEGMMMGGQMPQGADPAQLPDPDSAGAKLVGQYCTQCHGLPTPELHTAAGWLPVTQRMNMRMQWMSGNSQMPIKVPSDSDLQALTQYLQKNGAR